MIVEERIERYGKKVYDLEDRTREFAKNCRILVRALHKDIPNREDGKQLARSSGSIAANYIEANESLSRKDFLFRMKMHAEQLEIQKSLIQESDELLRIISAIIKNSESIETKG